MEQRINPSSRCRAAAVASTRRLTTSLMFLLGAIVLAVAARIGHAGEMHLLVNGKAIHLDHQRDVHYNESNWGAGFQYDFAPGGSRWVPFVTASGFSDSNRNPSYYAGGGWLKRIEWTAIGRHWHVDAGVIGFLMQREGFKNDKPFPGVLPAFSLGTERIAVNVTYIPRVDPKMVPIVFFQLKLKLADF